MKFNVPPIVHRILPYWVMGHAVMLFLMAMMSGIIKKMQMFDVDLSDMSLTNSEMTDLFKRDVAPVVAAVEAAYSSGSTDAASIISSVFGDGNNITAADLGLANKYEVGIWGFCAIAVNGSRSCSDAKFDWAKDTINMTLLNDLAKLTNDAIQLPNDLKDALKLFRNFSMYTQACFVSAFMNLVGAMGLGLFGSFVRPLSRKIWIMASMGIVMAPASAALMVSIIAGVVVGGIKDTAEDYGAKAKLNINLLVLVWSAVMAAIGGCVMWISRAPSANGPATRASVDGEKLIHGAGAAVPSSTQYQPIDRSQGTEYGGSNAMGSGAAQPHSGFEPYSHRG